MGQNKHITSFAPGPHSLTIVKYRSHSESLLRDGNLQESTGESVQDSTKLHGLHVSVTVLLRLVNLTLSLINLILSLFKRKNTN